MSDINEARATSAEARLAEVERERDEADDGYAAWMLQAKATAASLATATEALRRIAAMDWGWKGGGSEVRVPGKYATIANSALSTISSETAENLDSVKPRWRARVKFDTHTEIWEGELDIETGTAEHPDSVRLREALDFIKWVDTWVCNPAGAYCVSALDGLFGLARDRIHALGGTNGQ